MRDRLADKVVPVTTAAIARKMKMVSTRTILPLQGVDVELARSRPSPVRVGACANGTSVDVKQFRAMALGSVRGRVTRRQRAW